MNLKDLTQSVLAVLIVGAAIASLFVPTVNETASKVLLTFGGAVFGFYFGAGTLPTFGLKK